MKKFLLICLFFCIGLFQLCPQVARAQDVEFFVRDFYTWYMKQSLATDDRPVFDDTIFKYVCKCTAKRVRLDYKRVVGDSDYYIKGQDFGKELLDNLMVGKSIDVDDSLSLVPVSILFRKEYAPDIVVYVEKTNGRMCISKVERALWPNFRAPVY
ncbi:DUF3828 domain-containing protein [Desulfovibrio sp. UIB00]|uniref:DUF3828 domain-containing protein n=1 Tax=Desulfovibrio sp. UIB00 TaxID=2804314 RepID=UPI001F0D7098|nr:DUF3828 domain-containing protein [Desulfovibrio sp. UIB00]MCH5145692.1 DUF3828 domain-containing protein [Desulfovibrio sp. UIB00]